MEEIGEDLLKSTDLSQVVDKLYHIMLDTDRDLNSHQW
jgi:hypothetical protein